MAKRRMLDDLEADWLNQTILATAIPRIVQEFNSLDDIGWYGSSFFLTISAFSQFWGKAYTYFSLKWVLMTAIIMFEVGSLICGTFSVETALVIWGRRQPSD